MEPALGHVSRRICRGFVQFQPGIFSVMTAVHFSDGCVAVVTFGAALIGSALEQIKTEIRAQNITKSRKNLVLFLLLSSEACILHLGLYL